VTPRSTLRLRGHFTLAPPPRSSPSPYTTLVRSAIDGGLGIDTLDLSGVGADVEVELSCAEVEVGFAGVVPTLFTGEGSSFHGIEDRKSTRQLQSRENLVCRLALDNKNTRLFRRA